MIGGAINKTTKTKKELLNKKQEVISGSKPTFEPDRKPSLLINNGMSKNIVSNVVDSKSKQISINLFHTAGILKKNSKSSPIMNYALGQVEKSKQIKNESVGIGIKQDKQTEIKSATDKKVISENKTPAINFKAKKFNRDILRDRKSIANKEELQKYTSKDIKIEKDFFYNTVHKTSNLTKPKSSVFSYDHPSNTVQIHTNSEENLKRSPHKTLVTSNFILTTNYSDNNNQNKEDEFLLTTSPTNKHISADAMKIEIEPDILTSIRTLGDIIGQNTNKNLKNDDVTRLTELNSKIQNLEMKQDINDEYKNSRLNSYINDSKNLLVENNMIRRDTFIDNNFNKKLRLYDKDIMIDEINKNSDLRLKKYEILFDFIGNNIKELSDLVNAQASNNNNANFSDKPNRIPESKLPQRIKGKALSIDNKANPIHVSPRKILTDFDKSIVESSNDEEFFQDLLEHNFVNYGNFSNEMSSLRSKFDISLFGNKIDQTQNQYDTDLYNCTKNVDMPSYSDYTYNVAEEMEGSRIRKNTPSFINKIKIDPQAILKQVRDAQKTKVDKRSVYVEGTSVKPNITNKLVNSEADSGKRITEEEKSKCLIF